MIINNDINECLECSNPIYIKEPYKGQEVICPKRGHIHNVVVCFMLEGTGKFKKEE